MRVPYLPGKDARCSAHNKNLLQSIMATRTTTIRIPSGVRSRLDRYLTRSRLSLNQLVEAATSEYLDRHEQLRKDSRLLKMDEIDARLLEENLRKEGRDE